MRNAGELYRQQGRDRNGRAWSRPFGCALRNSPKRKSLPGRSGFAKSTEDAITTNERPMKKTERNCGNCQHYADGVCTAPLPISLVGIYWRGKVKADSGSDCPAHRLKVVRQRKLKL